MAAPLDLHHIYLQRIQREVVPAALRGEQIVLRVDGDNDTAFVVWGSRQRRVIARGSERGMRQLLPLVQAEFQRQFNAAILNKERGAVRV